MDANVQYFNFENDSIQSGNMYNKLIHKPTLPLLADLRVSTERILVVISTQMIEQHTSQSLCQRPSVFSVTLAVVLKRCFSRMNKNRDQHNLCFNELQVSFYCRKYPIYRSANVSR